jgi:NAD-dependent deacetylase
MGELERAVGALESARLVVATTGAGMSRESGIPTFRDAREGLWARYDPQELATRAGFRADPARVWGWYNYRRAIIARHAPHAGHVALARLEGLLPQVVVVTQNIDGYHQRAGSNVVLELHGSIHRFKCFEHDHPVDVAVPFAEADGPIAPPRCERCGSYVRPDVVWFGELLPPGVFERAADLARACDVMLVVGTSGIVHPAAGLPLTARAAGATVVEVNTEPSELTPRVDIFLQGPAGERLPQLVSRLEGLRAVGQDG